VGGVLKVCPLLKYLTNPIDGFDVSQLTEKDVSVILVILMSRAVVSVLASLL
jgi:hypothetical protein